MQRRSLLTVGCSALSAGFAGCLDAVPGRSGSDLDRRERPEPPDPFDASAAVAYATADQAAVGYNRRLDQMAERERSYESLDYECEGALVSAAAEGYVVLTNCAWSSTEREGIGSRSSGHGYDGSKAVYATQQGTQRAHLELDERETLDPPYQRRGVVVANFSEEDVSAELAIEYREPDADDRAGGRALDEVYELEAGTGHVEPHVTDVPGRYAVEVATGTEQTASFEWNVPDDERPSLPIQDWEAGDIGLGVYVLPGGEIEVGAVPADRPTA